MHDQYQEHLDFEAGASSWQQNAVAEGGIALASENARRLAGLSDALAAGKFVIVGNHDAFCSVTDACIGDHRWIQGIFDTREEADGAIQAIYQDQSEDPDTYYEVLPRAARPKVEEDPPFDLF